MHSAVAAAHDRCGGVGLVVSDKSNCSLGSSFQSGLLGSSTVSAAFSTTAEGSEV